MKKILFTVVLCSMLTLVSCAHTGGTDKKQEVEALLQSMEVQKMVDAIYTQVDQMLSGIGQQHNITPSEQACMDKYIKKITDTMKQEVNWDAMKGPIIDIYLKHYTEKEIRDMAAFYQSASGKSLIAKMPAVMQESLMVSQKMVHRLMPRVEQLTSEMQKELLEMRKHK